MTIKTLTPELRERLASYALAYGEATTRRVLSLKAGRTSTGLQIMLVTAGAPRTYYTPRTGQTLPEASKFEFPSAALQVEDLVHHMDVSSGRVTAEILHRGFTQALELEPIVEHPLIDRRIHTIYGSLREFGDPGAAEGAPMAEPTTARSWALAYLARGLGHTAHSLASQVAQRSHLKASFDKACVEPQFELALRRAAIYGAAAVQLQAGGEVSLEGSAAPHWMHPHSVYDLNDISSKELLGNRGRVIALAKILAVRTQWAAANGGYNIHEARGRDPGFEDPESLLSTAGTTRLVWSLVEEPWPAVSLDPKAIRDQVWDASNGSTRTLPVPPQTRAGLQVRPFAAGAAEFRL